MWRQPPAEPKKIRSDSGFKGATKSICKHQKSMHAELFHTDDNTNTNNNDQNNVKISTNSNGIANKKS